MKPSFGAASAIPLHARHRSTVRRGVRGVGFLVVEARQPRGASIHFDSIAPLGVQLHQRFQRVAFDSRVEAQRLLEAFRSTGLFDTVQQPALLEQQSLVARIAWRHRGHPRQPIVNASRS